MATATVAAANLSQSLLDQEAALLQEPSSPATTTGLLTANGAGIPSGDEFTPSSPAADLSAGFFTVNEASQFSPAAEALLSPTPAATPAPATPAAPAALPAAGPQSPTAKQTASANAAAKAAATATSTKATTAAAATAAATAGAATSAAPAIAQQLQILNAALLALGLDSTEIDKIDALAPCPAISALRPLAPSPSNYRPSSKPCSSPPPRTLPSLPPAPTSILRPPRSPATPSIFRKSWFAFRPPMGKAPPARYNSRWSTAVATL